MTLLVSPLSTEISTGFKGKWTDFLFQIQWVGFGFYSIIPVEYHRFSKLVEINIPPHEVTEHRP